MNENIAILKAALVALVVTVLIWVWAEGESLTTRWVGEVPVTFPTESESDLLVRPIGADWHGTVRVRLEGPVRTVERIAGRLSRAVPLTPALKGMPAEPADRVELDLRTPIADAIADHGSVLEVDPPRVAVAVDRMVTRTLPVRVVLPRPLPIDGDPVASPSSVEVRMPETLAAALGPDAGITASVPEPELAKLRNDGPQTVTAPVRLPESARAGSAAGSPAAVIRPESVTVTVRLRQTLDSVKLATVPVWFSLPPTEDGARWSVEILDKFLSDVTVTGPSEDVQRIRSGQTPIKGVIEFSSDELQRLASAGAGPGDRAVAAKQAAFTGLPPGVSATVANATIRVKVAKRAAAPGNGTGAPDPGGR